MKNAVITGIGGYVPEYILTNEELSRMVETSDDWILTRVGIKERRILNEEGLGSAYMGRKAVRELLKKTDVDPQTVDCVICATTTPDYRFPSNASIIIGKLGLKNAHGFDVSCACCGFLYTMDLAYLQELYEQINSSEMPVFHGTCPHCNKSIDIPVNFIAAGR